MIFAANRLSARLILIGALVGALGLAGCGRKGPLEPPPSAQISQPGVGPDGQPVGVATDTSFDERGRPIAPRGKQQPFILDGLLN